jgi:hypothetical protein
MPLSPPDDPYHQSATTRMVPSSQDPEVPIQDHVPPSRRDEHTTQMNSFNLFRVYDSDATPVHDPEDQSGDAGNSPLCEPTVNVVQGYDPENMFHPYPNETVTDPH